MPKPESLQADLRKHEQDIAEQDTGTQNPKEYDVQHSKPNEKFGIDIGKQEGNCKRTLFQVHNIVPLHTSAPYDYAHCGTISFSQMNRVIQWGQCLFMKRFWLSKMIRDFEILSNFLYDVVAKDDIDYPA